MLPSSFKDIYIHTYITIYSKKAESLQKNKLQKNQGQLNSQFKTQSFSIFAVWRFDAKLYVRSSSGMSCFREFLYTFFST